MSVLVGVLVEVEVTEGWKGSALLNSWLRFRLLNYGLLCVLASRYA